MKNPINILYATTSDHIAGAEKNLFDLLRALDRKKYNPQLVIFKHEQDGELATRVQALGIPVHVLHIQSKWQFYKLLHLCNIIKTIRPDILQSYLFFDNVACRVLGKLCGVRTVISGLENVEIKRKWWRNIIDRITLPLADAVVSNSDAAKEYYVAHGYCSPKKVWVAKSGIDMAEIAALQQLHPITTPRVLFGRAIPDGTTALLTVCFLTEQKGVTNLLKALALLKKKKTQCISFIMGQGALEASLKKEAEALRITDIVVFLGYQTKSSQYAHLFDLFVLPSLWEGLPNVIIEAMASRLPVIATDVGGVNELVTADTGFLVPPGNPEALAQAIEHGISLSEQQRQNMAAIAYEKVVAHFSVDSMLHGYERCYEHFV